MLFDNSGICRREGNHAEVVKRLLDAGAECGSWTAYWPASLGHSEVVQVLIESRPNKFGQDSLDQLLAMATQRNRVNATFFEALTIVETASAMKCSLANAKVLQYRAIGRLGNV